MQMTYMWSPLTSRLSGTYNAACVARDMYLEQHGHKKNIAVIDSKSGCAGETRMGLYIKELCDKGLPLMRYTERLSKRQTT